MDHDHEVMRYGLPQPVFFFSRRAGQTMIYFLHQLQLLLFDVLAKANMSVKKVFPCSIIRKIQKFLKRMPTTYLPPQLCGNFVPIMATKVLEQQTGTLKQ